MSMKISFESLAEGAFSLVAALAWNEAAKSIVERVVPEDRLKNIGRPMTADEQEEYERDLKQKTRKMKANIIYALVVTLFVIGMFLLFNTTAKVVKDVVDKVNSNPSGTFLPPSPSPSPPPPSN